MNPEAGMETHNLTDEAPRAEYYPQNEQGKVLERLAYELGDNQKIVEFFGLDSEAIASEVRDFSVREKKDLSPQFQSPGYGHATDRPLIIRSLIGLDEHSALQHEIKHGLHYALGKRYFEGSDGGNLMERYHLFAETVLGDGQFMQYIEKKGTMLRSVWAAELLANPPTTPQEVASIARELGGLVFQHAYFVDPALCEAVGSFEDRGIQAALNEFNRAAGSHIPHHQMFQGYGNKKLQEYFSGLPIEGKILLVKNEDYIRKERPVSSSIN